MPPAGGIPLALQIVVKSCPVSLDRVVAHPASFNENDHDLKTGYGEDLHNDILDVAPDIEAGMLADIERFDRTEFARSWQTLAKWNTGNHSDPHPAGCVSVERALASLDAVGRPRLSAIAAQIFTDPYSYYHGWPDLTILDSAGRCEFVEVKTTDRLHYGQIVTMGDMRHAAGLDIRVLRLRHER